MSKKLLIRIVAGILLSAVIIYFTIRAIGGLNPYWLLSANINWGLAVFSVVLFAFSVFVRAMVYPFGINKQIGVMEAFRIVAIGNAANMVLPIRAGELLRIALFPQSFSPSKRTWLVTVPAAADMLAIFSISELALPVSGFHNPTIVSALHIASSVILFAIIVLLILLFSVQRFKLTAEHFVKGSVFKMSLWVFFSWFVMLASIIFGLMAYGYNASQSVLMSFAIFASTNIVMLIPSTPGGIGLFEYGVVLGLEGFGITKFPAKEVGMLLHLIQYAALLPLGAWLYLYGIRRGHGDRHAAKPHRFHSMALK